MPFLRGVGDTNGEAGGKHLLRKTEELYHILSAKLKKNNAKAGSGFVALLNAYETVNSASEVRCGTEKQARTPRL